MALNYFAIRSRNEDGQDDNDEGLTWKSPEEEEEEVLNRIKEESRKRMEAILEKHKKKPEQQNELLTQENGKGTRSVFIAITILHDSDFFKYEVFTFLLVVYVNGFLTEKLPLVFFKFHWFLTDNVFLHTILSLVKTCFEIFRIEAFPVILLFFVADVVQETGAPVSTSPAVVIAANVGQAKTNLDFDTDAAKASLIVGGPPTMLGISDSEKNQAPAGLGEGSPKVR